MKKVFAAVIVVGLVVGIGCTPKAKPVANSVHDGAKAASKIDDMASRD